MPSYKFSLETLLNLRKRRLELTEIELMRAERRLKREQDALELTRKAIEIQRGDMAEGLKRGMMAHELQQTAAILDLLMKAEEDQQANIQRLEEELEGLRERRLKQYREKELLERFKEKDRERWLSEMARMEQKELDEIATQMYTRKL